MVMVLQRAPGTAPAVQASAVALPFADRAFDASLAILTVHHWPRRHIGLRELRRVARDRVVILTWDPSTPGFWLADYFPEILEIDRAIFPLLGELEAEVGAVRVTKVPIPHDCSDGFLGAYWRRPAAYLDPRIRSAMSTFSKLKRLSSGLERLRRDLTSGEWQSRYGHTMTKHELDLGYRLVVAHSLRRGMSSAKLHGRVR
jgi:SAM-dependent methyltransferase